LATQAILAALKDAHVDQADALYVGNMLSGELTGQENLGALIADEIGMRGIEAMRSRRLRRRRRGAAHPVSLQVAIGSI